MTTTDRRRYTDDQIQNISPIDLVVGDLVVERGPVGSAYYVASRVTWVSGPYFSESWKQRIVQFTLAGVNDTDHRPPYSQPERMRVGIVRRGLEG